MLSTLASAEMIRRPWATTRASARTRPVSFVIGRSSIALCFDRGEAEPGSSSGSPAPPLALSISVKAQPPWTAARLCSEGSGD